MSTPRFHHVLCLRSYPGTTLVSVWLRRVAGTDGPISGLLYGEMMPAVAEELIAALKLPVERDSHPLPVGTPVGAALPDQPQGKEPVNAPVP